MVSVLVTIAAAPIPPRQGDAAEDDGLVQRHRTCIRCDSRAVTLYQRLMYLDQLTVLITWCYVCSGKDPSCVGLQAFLVERYALDRFPAEKL